MTPGTHLRIETADLPWGATATPGVEHKSLAAPGPADRFASALFRLAPGAQLAPPASGDGAEVFGLAGEWSDGLGELGPGGYSRQPPGFASVSTERGCTLFVKRGPFARGDGERVHAKTDEQPWLPGQGGLRVKPLHDFEGAGTALVHWPAGERFVPHQHWGGEEILVLSGTFEDEHGSYGAGTWLRSPHLSAHHPFVREETVILVKTGHLPLPAG